MPGDTLNALPAAIFAGERVRRSVRGIIFPAIHGRLSRPFEADSPAPPSCPLLPAKKNPAGANLSVRPRIPLSSSPLCPRQRRGEVPGGSAANTVAGMASLGLACAFIGKVHDDALGQAFSRDIGATGIDFFTPPLTQGPSTGRSIVLVTPDAERSMFTYLGASTHLSLEDIDEEIIKTSRTVYVEGYLWEQEEAKKAILKAAELAHKYDRDFVFSLSDKSCVERHRAEFLDLIKDHVDILFGNENELNWRSKWTETILLCWTSILK